MDLGSISVSVCVMMVCLLGGARFSSGGKNNCTCPGIPPRDLTQPPPETCFQIDSRFRYQCVKGYLRRAGTSDLIRCKKNGSVIEWSTPNLECIRKNNCTCPGIPPRDLTQPPPETCFQIDSRFRYQCVKGYLRRAGTSDLIRCKKNGSVIEWSTPNLECIPDPRTTTTQPPKHTEVTSTGLQMTHSASTLSSGDAETNSAAPTPNVPVMQTTVKTQKTQSSTFPPSTTNNSTVSPPQAVREEIARVVGVSASLVFACGLIWIIFFLCRRRSNSSFTPQTPDEILPMNHVPSGPAS